MTCIETPPWWVGTSWKMNKTLAEARAYAHALVSRIGEVPGDVCPFVLPPATALAAVSEILAATRAEVGAQNAHWADSGAFTGEVSVPMVKDAGARIVELGHSERRSYFGETDQTVRAKVEAVLRHGLTPLICVGEDADVRAAGAAPAWVRCQALQAIGGIEDGHGLEVLVAYEPLWAIGDAGRPATVDELEPVLAELRDALGAAVVDKDVTVRLLYGGSVSAATASRYAAIAALDGLFVGRAAWDVNGFVAITRAFADARRAVPA